MDVPWNYICWFQAVYKFTSKDHITSNIYIYIYDHTCYWRYTKNGRPTAAHTDPLYFALGYYIRLLTSLNILALLRLLDLLLYVAPAHTSLGNPLSCHLRRHPNPSIAAQATHLHWQEDKVDVFEAEVRSLGVEEVDDRNEEGQQNHENEVSAPSDTGDQNW
jgi:hypothetical protein